MEIIILVTISVLGVLIPLMWITGILASIIYFIEVGITNRVPCFKQGSICCPRLGLTMADGGTTMAVGTKVEPEKNSQPGSKTQLLTP